jgi:hypothetical protein
MADHHNGYGVPIGGVIPQQTLASFGDPLH